MEISKLTFTNNFKEKTMGRKLSNTKKGELRIKRLKEADKDGTLAKAKTRFQIAEIGGFNKDNYSAGISWVTRMLKKRVITEVLVGYDKHNRAEYEYHYQGKHILEPEIETISISKPTPISKPTKTVIKETDEKTIVEIVYKGMEIKLYTHDMSLVAELVNKIGE